LVGFGHAAALARERLVEVSAQLDELRDAFEAGALAIAGARCNGAGAPRVPGTSNLAWNGVPGEIAMMALDLAGVAVSTGAACSSGSPAPSPVLLAMGHPRERAREAVRFSFGVGNRPEEVQEVLRLLPAIIARARAA
jgi:cysteine desulfurase